MKRFADQVLKTLWQKIAWWRRRRLTLTLGAPSPSRSCPACQMVREHQPMCPYAGLSMHEAMTRYRQHGRGQDELKLSALSAEDKNVLIDRWVRRHAQPVDPAPRPASGATPGADTANPPPIDTGTADI